LMLSEVDLVAVAQSAAAQAQSLSDRHPIRVIAAEPMPPGMWDADRIEQVLHNLISNAIKYTPEGGAIEITVAGQGPYAQVTVQDEGQGIAAEALPRLFERFFRASNVAASVEGLG